VSDDQLGYGSASGKYWNAGWKGILPLPPGKKYPPPKGTTGYDGFWPSYPDITEWQEIHPDGNLALRLPNSVIGIDVDHYGDKRGGDTLAHAESIWGALPPTVKSTSRIASVSGIRLYRVEPGVELETVLQFPELGLAHVEVIQYFHRFCVAWPSMHEGTQQRYRWIDAEGNILTEVPRPGALPMLPEGWVNGLARKSSAQVTAHVDVDEVLKSLPPGKPSARVLSEISATKTRLLAHEGTRHDTAVKSVLRLFRFAHEGEPGVAEALREIGSEFVKVVTKDGSRDRESAQLEFNRMVTGQRGHNLIASTPSGPSLEQLVGKPLPAIAPAPAAPQPRTEPEYTDSDDDDLLMGAPAAAPNLDPVDALLFAPEPEEVGTTGSRTSWGPIDIAAALAGDLSPEEPAVLRRADDKPILYRGRVNALVGEPESGKSWVALIAVAQVLQDNGNVFMLDFEDTPESVLGRLRSLGCADNEILAHFSYAAPDTALDSDAQEELLETLEVKRPEIVIVDGVNAAMTLMGMDLGSNVDATRFHQIVLKPLTLNNAAVIIIDHVSKDKDSRGGFAIGAQAKKAMTDGAMISVSAVEPFGRGKLGKLELSVLKDKPGGVRALTEKRGKNTDYLANVILDAREEGTMKTEIYFEEKKEDKDGISYGDKSLIVKMHEVSQFMQSADPDGNGISQNRITDSVRGRRVDVAGALNQLVETGYVEIIRGARNARLHRLKRPYRGPEEVDMEMLLGGESE